VVWASAWRDFSTRFLLGGGLFLLDFFAYFADGAAKTGGQFVKREAHVGWNKGFNGLTDL
jgi:hypothetical protein